MPTGPGEVIHVHSVQEEYFYLMVHPCGCGGAWQSESQNVDEDGPRVTHHVTARCAACGTGQTFHFQLDAPVGPKGPIRQVNPTDEPSRAIDLAGWMDLARFYLGRIDRLQQAVERAQSLLDARQCLEEALKFYDARREDPPASALWSKASRDKARRQGDAFQRSALVQMLDRIPPIERLRQADALDQKAFEKGVRARAKERVGRRWWQFWKLGRRR